MTARLRLPLLPPPPSALEIIERNTLQLPAQHRNRWKDEMTRSVPRRDHSPAPERLILELANTCNLDCPMCRVGRYGVDSSRFMAPELFERVLGALPSLREVRLNGLGEATLHPRFEYFVRRVVDSGLHGELITNLTCGQATIDLLAEATFTVLVSWDAATPHLFERLRRPASFNATHANLEALGAAAARRGRSDAMHLIFTMQRANYGELGRVVELAAAALVPNVIVNVIKLDRETWLERHADAVLLAVDEARSAAAARGVRLFLPDHLGQRKVPGAASTTPATRGCDRPWREILVRYNGEIGVCNMFNPYVYGHVDRPGVAESWNGSVADAFRRLVNTSERHPYCEGCYYLKDVHGATDRRVTT